MPRFEQLLGTDRGWDLNFQYAVQEKPEGIAQAFLVGETLLMGIPARWCWGTTFFTDTIWPKDLQAATQQASGARSLRLSSA